MAPGRPRNCSLSGREWSRSISRVLSGPKSGATISLGPSLPGVSCGLPGESAGHLISPYLALLRVGFARPACHQAAGRLLPGHFTLTAPLQIAAVCFCGTFPGVAPAGNYPAPCPVEPGLSSSAHRGALAAGARSCPTCSSEMLAHRRRRLNCAGSRRAITPGGPGCGCVPRAARPDCERASAPGTAGCVPGARRGLLRASVRLLRSPARRAQ